MQKPEQPMPDELDEECGLTAEESVEFAELERRCEVGVTSFTNDNMSAALILIQRLRGRWKTLRRALESA